MHRAAGTAALALAVILAWPACAAPALVILVRHAEKEAVPEDDPPLSAAGRERAKELAQVVGVLSSAIPIRAVFASEVRRTQQTAAPVAQSFHIAVTVVAADAQSDLVKRVLAVKGGTVIIVGHSNRVPELIRAMGGPAGVTIGDDEFNHLYVLAAPGSARAKLASLTYGK
jgi:phosphohistidine phosphatase SixA